MNPDGRIDLLPIRRALRTVAGNIGTNLLGAINAFFSTELLGAFRDHTSRRQFE
jgi:hypothetical protein